MLTRALFAVGLLLGTIAATAAEETKLLALGLADHRVSEEELDQGAALARPRFNSPGVAYAYLANLKKGDEVEVLLVKDGAPLMKNAEMLAQDQPKFLLQAGKTGVPAGGWPDGKYSASVKVMRDGKAVLEQASEPIPFE
jgi:hypothetical protein